MVFKKIEAKDSGSKSKVQPVGDVIPPPEKKHGPTVVHEAYHGKNGAHWSHEDKQHIKFLRNKIKDHKPIGQEDADWAKEHKIDVSSAVISTGKSSPRSPKAGKKKKVDFDHIFD